MKTTEKIKVLEVQSVERDYGMGGINAIIEHPKHGRLWLADGFGGLHSIHGGSVRWKYGCAIQLKPEDTMESLRWNLDFRHDRDPERPMLWWSSNAVVAVAKAAGLY